MAFSVTNWPIKAGYPTLSGDAQSMQAVAKYVGPWEERYEFVRFMFTSQFPLIDQMLDDPLHSFIGGLHPVKFSAIPLGGEQQSQDQHGRGPYKTSLYVKAVVTIRFSTPTFDDPVQTDPGDLVGQGDIISERLEPSGEFQTLSHEPFAWKTDSKKINEEEAPGVFRSGQDYIFTRHAVAHVREGVFSLVNHVNEEPLSTSASGALAGKTFAPETILYRGASLTRSEDVFGNRIKQTVAMRFSIRENIQPGEGAEIVGWNHFFRADTQRWDRLQVINPDGQTLDHNNFLLGDLSEL